MTEPIELFSGIISRVDAKQYTIEITLGSEFGRALEEYESAVFQLYVPGYVGFQVGQKIKNYLAVEEEYDTSR